MKIETETREDLTQKKCQSCEGAAPFNQDQIRDYLKCVPAWRHKKGAITREFHFKNYDEVLQFINKVANLAKREDHHPEIQFGYKNVQVSYSTHSAGGVTENDFISAAKVDTLVNTR